MTHDELLAKIDKITGLLEEHAWITGLTTHKALRAVVELHKPYEATRIGTICKACGITTDYPCPTIQAIEEMLK